MRADNTDNLAVRFDKDGYLQDYTQWTKDIATQLAENEKIDLSSEHWQVIGLLRGYYQRTDIAPSMRPLVKLVRNELGQELGNSAVLMHLFGGSAAKVAAKIAGLPRPSNCI